MACGLSILDRIGGQAPAVPDHAFMYLQAILLTLSRQAL